MKILALLLVLGVCGPSCAQQPASAPEDAPAPISWPGRAATVVREVEVGPWQLRWVGGQGLGFQPEDRADARAVAGALADPDRDVRYEGEGSVIVRMPLGEPSASARLAGRPAAAYKYLSADQRGRGAVQLQRTWFALYQPNGDRAGRNPKGLVVLLPGMFGTPEPVIDSFVGMTRKRGWHVLRMLTHASRFTERADYAIDPGGDIEGLARSIADELGDRAAECAMAVEAVCDHIAAERDDIPTDNRIALGMSGGGMILTTVVARDPDPYVAAVFIGAGCDFARISMESNYADWIDAVRVGWTGTGATPEADARFTEAYRAAARFDSYQTAPRLRGLPMLMIHGEADRAVPAAMGELLWERLGEPERWAAPLGHETLFLLYLPSRASDLLDWLDGYASP